MISLKKIVLLKESFEKSIENWFYSTIDSSNIPQNVISVLENNAEKVYNTCGLYKTDCGEISSIWKKIFAKNKIKAQIIEGNYINPDSEIYNDVIKGNLEAPSLSEHVWLLINKNIIFDPTASQFGNNIKIDGYLFNSKPLFEQKLSDKDFISFGENNKIIYEILRVYSWQPTFGQPDEEMLVKAECSNVRNTEIDFAFSELQEK
jgi:hypothetical protein